MPLNHYVREALQDQLEADKVILTVQRRREAHAAQELAEARTEVRVAERRVAALTEALDADDLDLLGADCA